MSVQSTVISYDYVFPLIGYEKGQSGNFEARQVYGTAFSIGGDLYMAAGHSMKEALNHEAVAIGMRSGRDEIEANPIGRYVIAERLDIAVFQARKPGPQALRWERGELAMLTPVRAVGYPYALDAQDGSITIRARRGEIVTSRPVKILPAAPRAYELSFGCPRGFSGAPLLHEVGPGGLGLICGVILQNVSTEMVVFGEGEKLTEAGSQRTLSKTEFTVWGLAIESDPILEQVFPTLLDGSIGEWLERHGLID